MFFYVTIYTFALMLFLIYLFRVYFLVHSSYVQYIFYWVCFITFLLLPNILFSIVEFKPFLAYMSIFHLTSVFAPLVGDYYYGGFIALLYVLLYLLLMLYLFSILFCVRGVSIVYLTDFQFLRRNSILSLCLVGSFAGMSGLPPFLGFWGKLGVVSTLLFTGEYVLSFLNLASGLVLLYFYFQNYRFLGFTYPGLLYRRIFINLDCIIIPTFLLLLIIFNVFCPFLVSDLYSFSSVLGSFS